MTITTTSNTAPNAARDIHRRATRPLVVLSFIWLIVFSSLLPHQGNLDLEKLELFRIRLLIWMLLALWFVFLIDYIILLFALRDSPLFWKKAGHGLLAVIFPNFRLGVTASDEPRSWIPFLGWRTKKRTLEKYLARFFSLPMIFIALMVLPILGIEYCRKGWLEHEWVRNVLSLGSQIIWLAFVVEFTVMISVTRKKMHYCSRHWIDLAIILLPVILFVVPFLSFLPIARLARLSQVVRSTRLFRLKGVGLKAFQALVLFSGTRRFGKNYHERRLKRLKERLKEMEEDMDELKQEIAELEEKKRMNDRDP